MPIADQPTIKLTFVYDGPVWYIVQTMDDGTKRTIQLEIETEVLPIDKAVV